MKECNVHSRPRCLPAITALSLPLPGPIQQVPIVCLTHEGMYVPAVAGLIVIYYTHRPPWLTRLYGDAIRRSIGGCSRAVTVERGCSVHPSSHYFIASTLVAQG